MNDDKCPRCKGNMVARRGEEPSCLQCGYVSHEKPAVDIESSEQLGAATLAKCQKLLRAAAELESEARTIRTDASRFAQIAQFCGVTLPPEVQTLLSPTKAKSGGSPVTCDECGNSFGSNHGLATHKARKHGPGWSTAGNFAKKDEAAA